MAHVFVRDLDIPNFALAKLYFEDMVSSWPLLAARALASGTTSHKLGSYVVFLFWPCDFYPPPLCHSQHKATMGVTSPGRLEALLDVMAKVDIIIPLERTWFSPGAFSTARCPFVCDHAACNDCKLLIRL